MSASVTTQDLNTWKVWLIPFCLMSSDAKKHIKGSKERYLLWGGGDSSVVRAPDSWLKGRGFESLLERRENFLLQGRLSVLTLISVSVPPPCYHSRWQVTAKTRIHLTYVAFIEPCFGIGHNLSLICQMTSEDIKHQLIIIYLLWEKTQHANFRCEVLFQATLETTHKQQWKTNGEKWNVGYFFCFWLSLLFYRVVLVSSVCFVAVCCQGKTSVVLNLFMSLDLDSER